VAADLDGVDVAVVTEVVSYASIVESQGTPAKSTGRMVASVTVTTGPVGRVVIRSIPVG
jgi:hypothetical protein